MSKINISTYSKNILKVFTGVAIGQLINILSIPIITRLFTKEAIGLRDLFISIVATFVISSSLKYDSAIVVSENEEEAGVVVYLSLLTLLVYSFTIFIVLLFFRENVLSLLKAREIGKYYYLVVLGVFVRGLQQIFQQILVREKKFGKFSKSKIIDIIVNRSTSVLWGIIYSSFLGLVISSLLGTVLSIFYISIFTIKKTIRLDKYSYKEIKKVAVKYIKFPLFENTMFFINGFSMQFPVFIISSYFGVEVLALFGIANKLINLPVNIVSQSIGRVYFSTGAKTFNEDKKLLLELYRKTEKKLIFLGSFVIISIYLASFFMRPLLGKGWEGAGVFMRLMGFYAFFRLIGSPISSTFTIIKKQELGLILVILSIVLRVISMIVFSSAAEEMVFAFSLSTSIFYIFYNYMAFVSIKRAVI